MDQQMLELGIGRQSGVEIGGQHRGYSDDREMLADYFRVFRQKMPLMRQLQRGSVQTGTMDHFNEAVRRIEIRLCQSKAKGEGRWLIRSFKKHGLQPAERMTVALVCYTEAKNGEGMDPGELLEMVCDSDRLKMLAFRPRLSPDSPLFKSGLLERSDASNPFMPSHTLKLGTAVKALVFGIYEEDKGASPKESKNSEITNISPLAEIKNPRQVYDELSKYLIGQENAKKAVAVAVYSHYLRIKGKGAPAKANILLYGPTGCGKTFLAELVAKLLQVPFFIADATQYTEMGYTGLNIEDLFKGLYKASGQDDKKASGGVVFIDEIDKLAAQDQAGSRINRDISGKGVQEGLLKAMEGGDFPGRPFTTDNVLFMAGGAFSELTKISGREQAQVKIGFLAGPSPAVAQTARITNDDFIKYGMLPELMGRFQVVEAMDPLGPDDLERILTNYSQNSLYEQYQKAFADHGIKLDWDSGATRAVAEKAYQLGTGARGLKSVLEGVMGPRMFEHFGGEVKEVLISENDVKGG